MPFDFVPDSVFQDRRRQRGARSHLTGISAKEAVCRRYVAAGYDLVESRKRCPEGEIDLLLRRGGQLVAVEVKASATHDLPANMPPRPSCAGSLWPVNAACWRWPTTASATCGWTWRWSMPAG